MSIFLLPRLVPAHTEALLDRLAAREAGEPILPETSEHVRAFAATGGDQLPAHIYADLQQKIRDTAVASGFPDQWENVARFDTNVAIILATHPALQSGEALRNDVWAYLAMVVLPDVALWRFPPKNAAITRERLLGGVRNVFQRLWLRAKALDRGPEAGSARWELLELLPEDAHVQLVERPGVRALPNVAKLIAEEWLRTANRIGRNRMEQVARLAIKRIRLRGELRPLVALPGTELSTAIAEEFSNAAEQACT